MSRCSAIVVSDLLAETLLHLRTGGEDLNHAHERAETDDLLTREVRDV